ncbi:MAG: DUF1223 domain-containing protein [Pyrinomonadaceae bacterium]|nr:DUF1223 domain-containing protein [Pyrinomonadaceae bacterium]
MKLWIVVAVMLLGLTVFAVTRGKPASSVAEKETQTLTATVGERTPVVVELFTSEGCSSCPPADDALAQFERTQSVAGAEVIALAQHVDYWNRLGWTDPYSHAAFSQRQGEYSQAFGKGGNVYTPQMIVDGQKEFPGGNRNLARAAIEEAARLPKAKIEIMPREESITDKKGRTIPLRVRVGELPAVREGDTAEVLLAITESDLSTDVPRGENAGRRLRHPSTVRHLSVLGTAGAGGEAAFASEPSVEIGRGWRRKNLRVVVFVQERASRRVLGAKAVRLAEEQ